MCVDFLLMDRPVLPFMSLFKIHIEEGQQCFGIPEKKSPYKQSQHEVISLHHLCPPPLENGAFIWSPHTDQSNYILEMVQRRAARYSTNRYHNTSSVTDMLQDLNWETLESRRTKLQLVMMFKITNDLVDKTCDSYNPD